MPTVRSQLVLASALCSAFVVACVTPDGEGRIAAVTSPLTISTSTVYRILSSATGKCVGIAGNSTANSAAVEARTCSGTVGQNFTFSNVATGYYAIRNPNSGKCLDVNGRSTANGATVLQYTCSASATNQHWAVAEVTPGVLRFTARHSGKVFEVNNGATADGTAIVQRTYSGAAHQKFTLSTGAGGAGGAGGSATGGAASGGAPEGGAGGTATGGAGQGGDGTAPTVPTKASVLALARLANDYFVAKWPNPGTPIVTDKTRPANIWTRAVYYEGLMALYAVDPQPAYYTYAVNWGTAHGWSMAYGSNTTRVADNQACGQTYLDLYKLDPQPARLAGIKASLDAMVNSTPANDWTWIDAIQMAMPVFAKLGVQLNNTTYFNKMYALYNHSKRLEGGAGLLNASEGLWWRDATFDPPYVEPNGQDCYWSRGNGWVYAALARVLDILPASDPHRAEYLADFTALSAALLPIQRSDGFWNVSLHDPNNFGGPELSGTALFTYGLAWGVRTGILDSATYLPAALRGYTAMASTVHSNGFLGWVQSTGKQPSDGQPLSFDKVPNFEDYGLGCYLLGASEIYRLAP